MAIDPLVERKDNKKVQKIGAMNKTFHYFLKYILRNWQH